MLYFYNMVGWLVLPDPVRGLGAVSATSHKVIATTTYVIYYLVASNICLVFCVLGNHNRIHTSRLRVC